MKVGAPFTLIIAVLFLLPQCEEEKKKRATRLAAPALEPDGAAVLDPQPAGWVSGVRGCLEGNMTRYFT